MLLRTFGVLFLSTLAMVPVAGCFKHPTIDSAKLTCKGPENCPKGTTCSIDNRCVPEGMLDASLSDGPGQPPNDGAVDRFLAEAPLAPPDSGPADTGSADVPVANDGAAFDAIIKPDDGAVDRVPGQPEAPLALPDSGPADVPEDRSEAGSSETGGAPGTGGTTSTGGIGGTGGVVDTGGIAGTGGIASTGGIGGTGGLPAHLRGLHAASVTDLGDNLYRVTYDFQSADQLSDWLVGDATTTTVALESGRLRVISNGRLSTVALARFVLPARITSLTLKSNALNTVPSGVGHTNIYLSTDWTSNDWTAQAGGYGCIINVSQGRLFVDSGNVPPATGQISPPTLLMNQTYEHVITMNSTALSWSLSLCSEASCGISPSSALTYTAPVETYTGTDRHLFLGAWETTVEFDDIRIVGYFGSN